MYKKIISVGMSFLILFEFSTVNTFAKGGDGDLNSVEGRNKEKPKYIDYCEDYPKNSYGKSMDVDCEIEHIFPRFKINEKTPLHILDNVGPTGETDVYLWKYIGLKGLTKKLSELMGKSNKEENKNRFIAEFIGEANDFFNFNSTDKTAKIINKWTEKSRYSKAFWITEKDVKEWLDRTIEKKKKMESNKWQASSFWGGSAFVGGAVLAKLAGAAILGAGGIGLVAGGIFAAGGYFKSKSEESEKYIKRLKKAEIEGIKLDVYYLAIDSILDLIKNNDWVNNDLLIAKLNFNKKRYGVDTYFTNVGIGVPKNVDMIFANLTRSLSKLINREEL